MTNSENQIGYHEITALLIILISGKIFLSFPRHMAKIGDAAGWLIILFSGILSMGGFYFIYALTKKFPSKNIIEIAQEVTGNIIGTICGLLIFFLFISSAFLALRQFAESFVIAFLPRTPISVIMTVFLILIVYANLLGIQVITRVSWFFGPYLLMALAFIFIFCIPHAKLCNLTPVLGTGPLELAKNIPIHTGLFVEIIFLAMVHPLVRKKEKLFKIGFWSITLATIINTVITALIIMIFNYVAAGRMGFPALQLARIISITEFMQRLESIFVFVWFFTAAIEMSALLYGATLSFAKTFKIRNYLPLIFPITILIFALSLLPDSMTAAVNLDDQVLSSIYPFIFIGIPFFIWFIVTFFKKKAGVEG